MKPVIIEISAKEFKRSQGDGWIESLPIHKVSQSGNTIVIFCGEKDENHIAEFRYELNWGNDNYLYINEIVPTGNDNEDARFYIGKFTGNNYLMNE